MGNAWPKLHNAMWPGIVGKGEEGNIRLHIAVVLVVSNYVMQDA